MSKKENFYIINNYRRVYDCRILKMNILKKYEKGANVVYFMNRLNVLSWLWWLFGVIFSPFIALFTTNSIQGLLLDLLKCALGEEI